jgi:DNA-directed RNA polymerase subunit F
LSSSDEGKPVLLAEVRKLLEEKTTEENRTYEQRLALQHAQQHVLTETDKGEDMVKDLVKIDRISEPIAVKIVDMMPEHPDDVRAIFAKERFLLTPEEIEKILSIVGKKK